MDRKYIEMTFADLTENVNKYFGESLRKEIEPEELERVIRNYLATQIKNNFHSRWNGHHGFDSNGNIIRRNH
jgi:hypothetical protein